MARNTTDLSSGEDSPNHELSWAGLCTTIDEVEHAVEVGQQIASLIVDENDAATTSGNIHVDRIARALLQSLDNSGENEDAEEEEEDSDEAMESESQTAFCYGQSEMEVSDPEAWMEIHDGDAEPSESEEMEDNEET